MPQQRPRSLLVLGQQLQLPSERFVYDVRPWRVVRRGLIQLPRGPVLRDLDLAADLAVPLRTLRHHWAALAQQQLPLAAVRQAQHILQVPCLALVSCERRLTSEPFATRSGCADPVCWIKSDSRARSLVSPASPWLPQSRLRRLGGSLLPSMQFKRFRLAQSVLVHSIAAACVR